MATANGASEVIECGICTDTLNWSRKLPECGHSYCETCLLIHVSNLKGDLDIGFACPLCKVISQGPKDLKAAIVWIKSLERGPGGATHTINEKTSEKAMCKFCQDCTEALCQACSVGRHSHPTMQDHRLVDIGLGNENTEETGELFQTLCELMFCDEHPANFVSFYCNDHGEYGCETCVDEKHRYCSDVVKANARSNEEDEDNNVDTDQLEPLVENLCKHANKMIENIEYNTEANNKEVKDVAEALRATREHVDALLMMLEVNGAKQAEAIAKKRKITNFKNTDTLKDVINWSKRSLGLMKKMERRGCQNQYRMVSQKIKKRLKMNEYTTLNMSQTLKKTRIELKRKDLLATLLSLSLSNNTLDEMVSVDENMYESPIPIYKSELLLEQYNEKQVGNVSTREVYKAQSPNYSNVKILQNDTYILVNGDDCVRINQHREAEIVNLSDVLKVKSQSDLNRLLLQCTMNRSMFAIPRPSEKRVLLLSANEGLKIEREINFLYEPKALYVLKTGDIALALQNPVAFGVFSVTQTLVTTKIYFCKDKAGRILQSFEYMAVDELRSHVFQPCQFDQAIYCFDFEGNPKFSVENIVPNVWKSYPSGISLDGDGNLYVCCYYSNYNANGVVQIISPTGMPIRTCTLGQSISKPLAVAFNRSGDVFAVTQTNSHDVKLFKLRKTN